ncbi:MAG TPA: protein kinase [Pyrinomonadaceae bacterium]|nr:protein kinase [Pyrinomonadaceae bacterium]
MRIEEWQRVEELLDAALELEPGGRRVFLEAITAPGLRREVESLLACEEGADGFLNAPALALSADFFDGDGAEDRAGQTVGHYRIIREIGRGGMGAVYLAERSDGEFEQRVALKVVRRSLAGTDLARRFRRERQILASLNHENVARLLDGGLSEDGEPYLVMEHVEGERIDEYCDANRLSTRERLGLFLKVCDAVAYAHQRLVVHRDIKPSNVLVTPGGTPKLLDFGIAKLLDPGLAGEQTRTELRAFTPDYASPEQVSGESVTTVSDVYSLGRLLQTLLKGAGARTPQRPAGWRSDGGRGGRTAAANLPTRPEGAGAATSHGLHGAELRNIVLMATRDEPARRYQSVAQLAEDVRRHLDGLPVRAQPDSLTYRTGKFVRRNRAAVTAAALVVVALLAGLGLALWQAGVARRERDRAERRFNDVRQLSNALLTDIAPKIENLQGATEARQSVVTQSLKYLDSLAQETGDDPQLQSELATAYEKVGDIQGNPTNPNLGDLAGAIASYEKARKMRLELLEGSPDDFEQLRLLAANHQAMGNLHAQANELEESRKHTDTALSLYEKLAAERPGSPELRLALAQITYEAGDARKDISKYTEAIAFFRKALELLAPLLQDNPDNAQYLKLAGACYSKLGNSLSWDGQQKEAEAETERAVRIYESLTASHPNDVSVSNGLWLTYWMASSTYEEQNDALSHEYALKALGVIQAVAQRDPANSEARQDVARTLSTLGQTSSNTGRLAEAVSYAERAVSELTRLFADDPRSGGTKSSIAAALMRLAEARAKQKDFAGALAELERAERINDELLRADATDTYSLRKQALVWDFRAEIHLEWAKTVAGARRRAHERAARDSYARAVEILEQLDAQKSLPESDRKWIERLRAYLKEHNR